MAAQTRRSNANGALELGTGPGYRLTEENGVTQLRFVNVERKGELAMCPMCMATVAWIAASATSTGGISALVVSRLRGKNQQPTTTHNHEQGERHGQ